MTVLIQNTAVTNTFDFWRSRTNELAYAMSNSAVTVNSNTATGNAAITGTFTANALVTNTFAVNTSISVGNSTVNAVVNSTSIALGNSSVVRVINTTSVSFDSYVSVGSSTANAVTNTSVVKISNSTASISLSIPTAAQISNGQYFHNANGQYTIPVIPYTPISNGTVSTSGTSAQLVDSYLISTYNSADYTIAAINGSANGFSATKLVTYHDVGNAYITEYAVMYSNAALGVFSANANTTHVRLYITPTYNSLSLKYVRISV
jgi:hypothetical protein